MKRYIALAIVIFALDISVLVYALYKPHTATQSVATHQQAAPAAKPAEKPATGPTRQELLDLTNRARTDNGLPALTEDPRLDASAQMKADDESIYGFGHTRPGSTENNGLTLARSQYQSCPRLSENITDNIWRNTAESAIHAFMVSPPHRAAILNVNDVSVGFGISGRHIVQHFCLSR